MGLRDKTLWMLIHAVLGSWEISLCFWHNHIEYSDFLIVSSNGRRDRVLLRDLIRTKLITGLNPPDPRSLKTLGLGIWVCLNSDALKRLPLRNLFSSDLLGTFFR